MNILLLEDNISLAGSLGDYLEEKGVRVDFAYNGKACLNLVDKNEYDIFVLDIAMPGLDGLDVCKAIREEHYRETPIIFLTARDTLQDKISGYQAGCDDYLIKPFEPEELLLRIKALNSRGYLKNIGIKQFGCLNIDFTKSCVHRDGQPVTLHSTQFHILKVLLKHSPNIVSKQTLEREIWGDSPPDSDALRTHIYRLRNLLDKPFEKALISTAHGKGYSIVFN